MGQFDDPFALFRSLIAAADKYHEWSRKIDHVKTWRETEDAALDKMIALYKLMKCRRCDGTGYQWEDHICEECKGTRVRYTVVDEGSYKGCILVMAEKK